MSVSEVTIFVGALGLTSLLAWYFFGPKKSRQAELSEGVQIIKVTVKGGYSPDVIQVTAGVPVRMLFDRKESGDCSSRVILPDFRLVSLRGSPGDGWRSLRWSVGGVAVAAVSG